MTLKVGSIVICHGWESTEGMKGFIEEIISDPALHRNGKVWTGKYSVYGFEKVKFESSTSYYFGDFFGANLEETGDFMTVKDLEKYMHNDPVDKMLQIDIPVVIKNLGRELGGNEGRDVLIK